MLATKGGSSLRYTERAIIHWVCWTRHAIVRLQTLMAIDTFGSSTILTISQQNISIRPLSCAKRGALKIPLTMRFGQTSVLNCGSYCILAICIPICTAANTGQSFLHTCAPWEKASIAKIGRICTKFFIQWWIMQLQMPSGWTSKTRINCLLGQPQAQRYMSWLRH